MCNTRSDKLKAVVIESSNNLRVQCCVCLGSFEKTDTNTTKDCTHNICNPCMREYLEKACRNSRYKDFEDIYCPGFNCNNTFNTSEIVSKIFTKEEEEQEWWCQALQTAFIKNKVVCPFDDCHEIYDTDENLENSCIFTECQQCNRGFCLTCRKKWHTDQPVANTHTTEINMLATAEKERWSRCPRCKNMVEKTDGCNHIHCRCGIDFCYRCGSKYAKGVCANLCNAFSQETLDNVRKPMFYVERFSNR